MFVWKKGETLDAEVETDQQSPFPSGKAGYGKSKVIDTHPHTKEYVKRTLCLTLGKQVIIKVFRHVEMLEMNDVFKEALVQAKCTHPNICEFLDFRLFMGKDGKRHSYIVMESLKHDLITEIKERKGRKYDEVELLTMLLQVTAGLLYAKFQDIAHQDIKPQNILRGPNGLKLADFGSAWQKRIDSITSSASGTEGYMAPEVWQTLASPSDKQRPFQSDVYSLGVTMLHLAAMKLPPKNLAISPGAYQELLEREVQALTYTEEFKQLIMSMLSIEPKNRPKLEFVLEKAISTYRQETQKLQAESTQLTLQNKSFEESAIQACAAAHDIYTRNFSDCKDAATNLQNWGTALDNIGRSEEALEKYAAAYDIYSRHFPDDKDTADHLRTWGDALRKMNRSEEALAKYAAADDIYSRLFADEYDTANHLRDRGGALFLSGKKEKALLKYAAAHDIYSTHFPDHVDTAICLIRWGYVLHLMRREEEAVEKYAAAHDINSRHFPDDKHTAVNLCIWAHSLLDMGRSEEALAKYAAANDIYSTHFPDDKYSAFNLRKWGDTLRIMERSESMMKQSAVRTIFSLPNATFWDNYCDDYIAEI